jgi:hypothetical protein
MLQGRLQRLIRLRGEYSTDLDPRGLRLLDRAIDATYRDCIDYGGADYARPIISAHRRRQWDERNPDRAVQ